MGARTSGGARTKAAIATAAGDVGGAGDAGDAGDAGEVEPPDADGVDNNANCWRQPVAAEITNKPAVRAYEIKQRLMFVRPTPFFMD